MKSITGKMIIIMAMAAVLVLTAVPVSAASQDNPVVLLELSKESVSMKAGDHVGLAVTYAPANTTDSKDVTWKSSDPSVATVKKGSVRAKKAGFAKITAKMGEKTAVCKVTVKYVKPEFVKTGKCYKMLNKYRKNVHHKALKRSAKLEKLAKIRAKELVKKFSHTRPNGKKGMAIIKGNIYKGENIAMGQETCAEVSRAWYKSPGHRANMLRTPFKKVGIAGFKYNGVIYWVQLFSS